jgi:hypothetical protein
LKLILFGYLTTYTSLLLIGAKIFFATLPDEEGRSLVEAARSGEAERLERPLELVEQLTPEELRAPVGEESSDR